MLFLALVLPQIPALCPEASGVRPGRCGEFPDLRGAFPNACGKLPSHCAACLDRREKRLGCSGKLLKRCDKHRSRRGNRLDSCGRHLNRSGRLPQGRANGKTLENRPKNRKFEGSSLFSMEWKLNRRDDRAIPVAQPSRLRVQAPAALRPSHRPAAIGFGQPTLSFVPPKTAKNQFEIGKPVGLASLQRMKLSNEASSVVAECAAPMGWNLFWLVVLQRCRAYGAAAAAGPAAI